MAMLVDVAMARHWYQQRSFIQEHVYDEMQPTFAHVGGWWAKHSGLRRYPGFEETYFELPTYIDPRWDGPFRNVFARRSMVMMDAAEAAVRGGDTVRFEGGVTLRGLSTPTAWSPGVRGYLEAPIQLDAPREADQEIRLLVFLAGEERTVSWQVPLGYNMYPQAWFEPDQVFRGKHAVTVPAGLPLGVYDLGFVVLGPDGAVLPALTEERVEEGESAAPPRFAEGEALFERRIEVVSAEVLEERVAETRRAVHVFSRDGRCERAEHAWIVTKRHRPKNWEWHDLQRPVVARAIADCWAGRAETEPDRAVEHLDRAHWWDHWSEELDRVGTPLAERLLAEGLSAREAQDWETAYRRFAAVLRFQPWRAWARRHAEEARDHRLGLTDDVRIGIGGEDDLRAWEEQQAAQEAPAAENP